MTKVSTNQEELLEELSGMIMDSLQIGLRIWHLEVIDDDSSLRVVAANPVSAKTTGIPSEELAGTFQDESFLNLREHGDFGAFLCSPDNIILHAGDSLENGGLATHTCRGTARGDIQISSLAVATARCARRHGRLSRRTPHSLSGRRQFRRVAPASDLRRRGPLSASAGHGAPHDLDAKRSNSTIASQPHISPNPGAVNRRASRPESVTCVSTTRHCLPILTPLSHRTPSTWQSYRRRKACPRGAVQRATQTGLLA